MASSGPPPLCRQLDLRRVEGDAFGGVEVGCERWTGRSLRAELSVRVAAVLCPPAVARAAELRIVGMRVVEECPASAAAVVVMRQADTKAAPRQIGDGLV